MRKILTALTLTAAAALSLPAFAQADAAACASPAVSVTAAQTSVVAGSEADYSYSFCYDTAAQDYTVQVVQATAQGNVAVAPLQTLPLAGSSGTVQQSSSFTPSGAGVYHIIVTYYEQGQTAYQSQGETTVVATAAPQPPVTTPTTPTTPVTPPTPPVTQPTPPTATPAPTPIPVTTTPPVKKPQGTTRPVDPKLRLVKTANVKHTRVGGKVIYTLKVTDLGPVAAKRVQVCDSLPAGSLFDSATAHAAFDGSRACFSLGTVKPHKSKVVRITLTLTHKGRTVNHATAKATAAKTVRASATVRVVAVPHTTLAPVTG